MRALVSADLDHFDHYYRHLILWDDSAGEIVGAYRLGEIWKWPHHDHRLLYSSTLFNYNEDAAELFTAGLELGRFCPARILGQTQSGLLMANWRLFGAASAGEIPLWASFTIGYLPKKARDLLVCYYGYYYPDPQNLAKTPNVCDADAKSIYDGPAMMMIVKWRLRR